MYSKDIGEGKEMTSKRTESLEDFETLASRESSNDPLDHVKRIAKFSECKKHSLSMVEYLKDISRYENEYVALTGCANYLVFNNYYTINEVRLSKIRTCKKHQLCKFCASIRSVKQANAYFEKFQEVRKSSPDLIPVMITLTVKNGFNFKERFDHLTNSFKKLQKSRRDYLRKGTGFNEFCKIEGAAFSYETTYSDEKGYHPHIHMVAMLDKYIVKKKLDSDWEKITKDSKVTDVRELKGFQSGNEQELFKSFLEVFKYSLKFSDLKHDQVLMMYDALRGRRLQGSFGCFWGVEVPENDTDELFEDLPYIELFYKYSRGKESYTVEEVKHVTNPYDKPEVELIDRSTGEVLNSNDQKLTAYLTDLKKVREDVFKLSGANVEDSARAFENPISSRIVK